LVVGQLPDVGAVVAHHEDFTVRLRRVGIGHFVFEAHPRRRERDELAIGRPGLMGIVASRVGQPLHTGAVGLHGVDLVIAVGLPRKHDQVAAR
jgi:hypothetical protein